MFFSTWRKRPHPRFKVGQMVMVPSIRPETSRWLPRYLIVRKRRWSASSGWLYEGIIIAPIGLDSIIVVRHYAEVDEQHLKYIHGGDLGL